jgi:hypothetical protein
MDSASDSVGEEERTPVSDGELRMFVEYIDRVQFGTVTLHIKSLRIVGVEKNEKIKFRE